jgi:hypothetical protein
MNVRTNDQKPEQGRSVTLEIKTTDQILSLTAQMSKK